MDQTRLIEGKVDDTTQLEGNPSELYIGENSKNRLSPKHPKPVCHKSEGTSKVKMPAKDFEESLKLTKLTLLISGIKMEPGKWGFFFKILFPINFIWLLTDVFGELLWLVEGIQQGKSFLELSYIAPCATISILSLVKSFYLYTHENFFINVVAKLKSIHPDIDEQNTEDKTNENKELNNIIRRNVKESSTFLKHLIKMDLIMCLVVVLAFCFLPISAMGYDYWKFGTSNVTFPFQVKFFFDVYRNTVWPFVYFHQVWSTFVAFFNTFGADTFFFSFCVYMRMHFRILQRRFQDAVSEREDRQFVAVVQRHQELVHLAEQVEILYSKSTLFNIIISSVLICLSAFNVTSSVEDKGAVFSFLAFLSMSLMQIFFMCYFGDMLMRSSMEISDAIYNSVWYHAEQGMKKNVLFVLTKSRKPCKLTAARFADVNLTAFTTILSRSWSLFALLKTVYK